MKLFTIAIAAFIVACSSAKEVCYDDLGCFSTDYPFTDFGRIGRLPESPEEIQTQFLLYTRNNIEQPDEVIARNVDTLKASHFNASAPVKFVLHGFIDGEGIASWMWDMAYEFLAKEICNVFVINWAKGARRLYGQSAANSRVVGAQIAQMADFLKVETGGADPAKIHIIGHSLGAHAAGYASENIVGLGRITGMDPAGPYFEDMHPQVRLDENDAAFVDAVHTDGMDLVSGILGLGDGALGFGSTQSVGHVDVYPNGGIYQPGCENQKPISTIIEEGIIGGIRELFVCGHMRSVYYTTESIRSTCTWRTYRCDKGYEEFLTGRCLHCPSDSVDCNYISSIADKPTDGSVNNKYYILTNNDSPFCVYHYHIKLQISSKDNKEQQGIVWVKLIGDGTETDLIQLGTENFKMKPGNSYDFLITSQIGIQSVSSITIKWKHDAAFYEFDQWQWGTPSIYVDHVVAFSGDYQTEAKYCDNGSEFKSKDTRNLAQRC